jgi:hypothetical protein
LSGVTTKKKLLAIAMMASTMLHVTGCSGVLERLGS